jgi:hypothetical protein
MLPATDVSSLPAAARASVLASRADFVRADRGHVRAAGDYVILPVGSMAKDTTSSLQSLYKRASLLTSSEPTSLGSASTSLIMSL